VTPPRDSSPVVGLSSQLPSRMMLGGEGRGKGSWAPNDRSWIASRVIDTTILAKSTIELSRARQKLAPLYQPSPPYYKRYFIRRATAGQGISITILPLARPLLL